MIRINSSDGLFHDGDPSAGTQGTIVTADWLNAIQEVAVDTMGDIVSVTAAHTFIESEGVAFCDTTAGAFAISLPVYASVGALKRYIIKNVAAHGSADLVVNAADGLTIDRLVSINVMAGEKVTIIKDGTSWQTI
jgi:hypothetical protein